MAHAGEGITGVETQPDNARFTRVAVFTAVGGLGNNGRYAPFLPFKPQQVAACQFAFNADRWRADCYNPTQIQPRRRQLFGRPAGKQPRQFRPRHHGLNFRRPRCHHHLFGVDVEHSGLGSRHHQRPAVNANRLLPIGNIQPDRLLARHFRFGQCRPPRLPLPNNHHIAMVVVGVDFGAVLAVVG